MTKVIKVSLAEKIDSDSNVSILIQASSSGNEEDLTSESASDLRRHSASYS